MSKRKKKKYADPQSLNLKASADDVESSQDNSDSGSSAGSQVVAAASPGAQDAAANKTASPQKPGAEPKKKRQLFGKKEQEPGVETYKRPLWKHLIRFVILGTIILLNVSMIGSFVTRLEKTHELVNPMMELFFFATAAIVNLLFGIPAIFEVNRVRLDNEYLKLNTLLWQTRLKWSEIVEFEQPRFLKFAILRTKRCFYLINRRDINSYNSLAQSITDKMASTKQ